MGILNTTYSLIAGPEKSFFYTIFRSARHTDESEFTDFTYSKLLMYIFKPFFFFSNSNKVFKLVSSVCAGGFVSYSPRGKEASNAH
jgi:hypothetical protein